MKRIKDQMGFVGKKDLCKCKTERKLPRLEIGIKCLRKLYQNE